MRRVVLVALVVLFAAPGSAQAARFSVGLHKGADPNAVARRLEAVSGQPVTKIGSFALSVRARHADALGSVKGVSWVERDRASRNLAFSPNDPLAVRQWYLSRIHAFDAWPQFPSLEPVRVAVLDSGVDSAHPELQNQIVDGKTFVPNSSWENDTNGHGTFVAGEIAAALNNGKGIAGVGFPADLLIAKIVRSDGTISPVDEARAIRWAVNRDARVINMSFGGVRDPRDPGQDTYSRLEAAAVQYAVSKGVLVVAAVGNADSAPTEPWGYAGYPAALPHVLGVSSIARDGTVPTFSNRDVRYDDIAAPGEGILSTLPESLTQSRPACPLQGYSDCGPIEFRRGEGTSFSAPLVSAGAALLFASSPFLQADQVSNILTRTAADATPDTGCIRCIVGRDSLTGWGQLDIASAVDALDNPNPAADHYEVNDQVANASSLWGRRGQRIHATVDYWDDRQDIYRIYARKGETLVSKLRGPGGTDTNLFLWKPGTTTVRAAVADERFLAGQSKRPGSKEKIRVRVKETGWYYLVVRAATPGAGRYTLRYRKRFPVVPPAARP